MPFLMALVWRKMQTASTWIRTLATDSISHDDNRYAKSVLFVYIYVPPGILIWQQCCGN